MLPSPFTVTVPLPRAVLLATLIVPVLKLVPPEWLLAPDSVNTPVPVLMTTPVPVKTRSTVRVVVLAIESVFDERISIEPLPLFIDAGSVSLPPSWSVLPTARFTP